MVELEIKQCVSVLCNECRTRMFHPISPKSGIARYHGHIIVHNGSCTKYPRYVEEREALLKKLCGDE